MKKFCVGRDGILNNTASNGDMKKWVITENDTTYFIKRSSRNRFTHSLMFEHIAEVLVSDLAVALGLTNVVKYNLCEIHDETGNVQLACYCPSFLSRSEQLAIAI